MLPILASPTEVLFGAAVLVWLLLVIVPLALLIWFLVSMWRIHQALDRQSEAILAVGRAILRSSNLDSVAVTSAPEPAVPQDVAPMPDGPSPAGRLTASEDIGNPAPPVMPGATKVQLEATIAVFAAIAVMAALVAAFLGMLLPLAVSAVTLVLALVLLLVRQQLK